MGGNLFDEDVFVVGLNHRAAETFDRECHFGVLSLDVLTSTG